MSQRKTFYLHDDKNLPIMAGGIVLYKIENDNVYLLLIEKNGMYEDLGGKSDTSDGTFDDIVCREVFEESNYLISKESIKERLCSSSHFYNFQSKYITYIVQANEQESNFKSEDFGDKEIHENIPRKIKWVPLNVVLNQNIIKYKLSHRLKHKYFFDMVKNIKKSSMEWDVINK